MSTDPISPCELATGDSLRYDDPLAKAVVDHLREKRMLPLVWTPMYTTIPDQEWNLSVGTKQIHIGRYGTATLCVSVNCGDDIEVVKRESPAKILDEVENVAAALRAMLGR